jgi:general secretion pathway protein D
MDVLKAIAQKSGMNIIAGRGVAGKVTIYLSEVKLKDALRIILDANGLAYQVEDGIIRVMPAKEFETRYGYVFGGEWETRIVRLTHVNAADMVAVLNQMKSSSGKIIFDAKSNTMIMVDSPQRLKVMEGLIQQIDVPVETRVFELSYVRAKDVAEKIGEVLTQNVGQVKFDERSNKIIITDTRLRIDKIAGIIEAFDVKGDQVLIEAKIVQVVLSHQHQFGVDWEALAREYQGLNFSSQFDVLSSGDKSGKVTIGTLSEDDYTALLEVLKTEGLTNILSSPSITALNNEEAKILIGSQEPYVTTTTTTPSSGPTTTAESITFLDVGIELNVTPTIHKDHFVTLKIRPAVSSVTKTVTTSNNNTIPVVETSEAETTVLVKDGVTIVIGGLIKDEKIRTDNKVPLLGDIPLLGYAFRNQDDLVRKTEIVIFLTPRIISGDIPGNDTLERLRNVKKAGSL